MPKLQTSVVFILWAATVASAQPGVAFPQPRVLLAQEPESGPLSYEAQSLTSDGNFAMRIELDGASSLTEWTWFLVVPQVTIPPETPLSGQYPFLEPLPANEMDTFKGWLDEEQSANVDLDDRQALGSIPLGVPASACESYLWTWLSQEDSVAEYAQLVDTSGGGPDRVHWEFAPLNWGTGAGVLQQDFWARASDGRVDENGDWRILFDPAALAEVCAYSQAVATGNLGAVGTPGTYNDLRYVSANWRAYLRNYTVTLQVIAVRASDQAISNGPNPSGIITLPDPKPIRLSLSAPAEIVVTSPNTPPGPGNAHPHPYLSEILGMANPPYWSYAGEHALLYMSKADVDTKIVFETAAGDVERPITIVEPCLVRVLVPGSLVGPLHFDISHPDEPNDVIGSETEYGTTMMVVPQPPIE